MTTRDEPCLPDAQARAAIAEEVDINLVVEAAAGTGKTTSLVARLLTLFKRGALAGESRLAAVTFTHKAAAELRERLERELASILASGDGLSPAERTNLAAAAQALPECHIGTIHSFCGRLLRERPVEAGIGLNFQELDDDDDARLRRQAWDDFAAAMRRGEHDRQRRMFELFGLDNEALARGFESFAEYPDVDAWPGNDRDLAQVDVAAFALGVERYLERADKLRPILDDALCGNDKLLPILQILARRWPRLPRPLEVGDAFRLSGLFKPTPGLVQAQWKQFGMNGDAAKEELAAYTAFHAETVEPFRRDCLAAVYAAALEAFREAQDIYDRLRREKRLVNFQDLLLATARLLREYPEVRADFAARYARLLVDEVQDTDPVQAEIMFLLASGDLAEPDWRRCRPRPGSLFIVGDPKQSIYRFRRADIVVYQEVKRLLVESGGRVLGLTTNFRSQPSVIDWVNRTFLATDGADDATPEDIAASGRFASVESPYSPAYIELEPGRPPAVSGFTGVYRLETIPLSRKDGIGERDVIADEADRIAAFIRHAVDGGMELPDRDGYRPAVPGDFLVVSYQKAVAAVYADAIRRTGLPCRVSSGATLANSPALSLLAAYVRALAFPDDPVLTLAVLRGELFGMDDRRLYRWKKAGGRFDVLSPLPEEGDAEMAAAMEMLRRNYKLFRAADPASALVRVVDDLGLWPLSCLGDDADGGAGAFASALERLARERADLPTAGKLSERLDWLLANCEDDPLPAAEREGTAVRVMNLHKTKGLEAPVVFLTSTRTLKARKPVFAVRRAAEGAFGAMAIVGGEFGNMLLAQPADWDVIAAEEDLFLAAERTRLNYVAATRAGAALIVSVHKAGKGWKSAFLPDSASGEVIPEKLPEPERSPRAKSSEEDEPLREIDAGALKALAAERAVCREAMLRETYATVRAKPDAVPEMDDYAYGGGADGLELGEILHRLLEERRDGESLRELATELLAERQLSVELAEGLAEMVEAVLASPLWKRANRAEVALRETPYSLAMEDGVIQRGVIDLAFCENGRWVIVDYKSDTVEGERLGAAVARHTAQLAAYARAWERITGETVGETGLYFLRPGKYVVVDLDS